MKKSNKIFIGLSHLLDENGPTLCTVASALGVLATLYFSYKASKNTANIQSEYEAELEEIENSNADESTKKAAKTNLKVGTAVKYIVNNKWGIMSGTAAIGFGFASNFLNGRKLAGLAAALALSEEKWKKGVEKAKEILRSEEYQKIVNAVNTDLAREHENETEEAPFDTDDNADGLVDYYDTYVGHYIKINPKQLQDAINEAKKLVFVRWCDWRGMLGLESPVMGTRVGWGNRNRFNAHIGQIQIGNRYVNAIIYDEEPVGLSGGKK
jgi:ElaB/YqjD/DUF883 family membrane-anchored ribosome-binding protein